MKPTPVLTYEKPLCQLIVAALIYLWFSRFVEMVGKKGANRYIRLWVMCPSAQHNSIGPVSGSRIFLLFSMLWLATCVLSSSLAMASDFMIASAALASQVSSPCGSLSDSHPGPRSGHLFIVVFLVVCLLYMLFSVSCTTELRQSDTEWPNETSQTIPLRWVHSESRLRLMPNNSNTRSMPS